MTPPAELPSSNGSSEERYFVLQASYQSPTNEAFTHAQNIPAPASEAIDEKTTYLSALRKATTDLQERINKDLTARMEEDKAREGEATKSKVDEAKEEDNYGEEVVEEE
ncbi:hypothetical protein GLAREA_03412 [Glarea lozoyensis ATCC 20868]|uniref:EKC/KEOPS complex subunit GON7 n=1 Tax=Glarea lozoyensis (strain ATCC 20868 / MF5171) TaxID=1116229 RepID=S3CXW3_GLAL2|nr:uncharacterized protein GLAREA_03412 [Glarea lozoyensis ATCC 20868]EPE30445.1 hypothetical protein GLAREA_03412 [Glarea lozoyensis ATCC 20868]